MQQEMSIHQNVGIDSQEAVGIDRGSDQYRLMLGSNEEAAGLRTAEALTGDQYSF